MRHWLPTFVLLSGSALAQAGELTLSPASLSVDNGQTSSEIVLTYRPGDPATDMDAELALSPDRHGWAQVEVIPSSSPDWANGCQLVDGRVRLFVTARNLGNLPAGVAIPVCRMRVRTHAHTSHGFSWISVVGKYELWHATEYPVTSNNTLLYVPF